MQLMHNSHRKATILDTWMPSRPKGSFTATEEEATQSAEQLLVSRRGTDHGRPECYYDGVRGRLVLALEYGGDGGTSVGECATKQAPIAAFPAHWAPNGMALDDRGRFPSRYRHDVFIAFHDSWNRAPYPQDGYIIVFQGLTGGRAAGNCEILADRFAGPMKTPDQTLHRAPGVAVGPVGSLYVSDHVRGRLYRISNLGAADPGTSGAITPPCPRPSAPAGALYVTDAQPRKLLTRVPTRLQSRRPLPLFPRRNPRDGDAGESHGSRRSRRCRLRRLPLC